MHLLGFFCCGNVRLTQYIIADLIQPDRTFYNNIQAGFSRIFFSACMKRAASAPSVMR